MGLDQHLLASVMADRLIDNGQVFPFSDGFAKDGKKTICRKAVGTVT
jgi:hypothetical protein